MAILKIARMGHPVLSRRADEVPDPTAPAIRHLVADMIETMEDAEGAGLAAPQVHVGLRVVVFRVPAERAEGDAVPLSVLVNPVLEPLGEETELGIEACLSLPHFAGIVARRRHLRYRALALDGRSIEREAHGFHARVVQHECDHLDGVLYPQRIADLRLFGYAGEMRRALARAEAAREAAE